MEVYGILSPVRVDDARILIHGNIVCVYSMTESSHVTFTSSKVLRYEALFHKVYVQLWQSIELSQTRTYDDLLISSINRTTPIVMQQNRAFLSTDWDIDSFNNICMLQLQLKSFSFEQIKLFSFFNTCYSGLDGQFIFIIGITFGISSLTVVIFCVKYCVMEYLLLLGELYFEYLCSVSDEIAQNSVNSAIDLFCFIDLGMERPQLRPLETFVLFIKIYYLLLNANYKIRQVWYGKCQFIRRVPFKNSAQLKNDTLRFQVESLNVQDLVYGHGVSVAY